MTTPAATYSRSSIANGQRIYIVSITNSDASWDNIEVQLSDGTNFAEWEIAATDLDGGAPVLHNYTTQSLGTLTVCCWVFDGSGNGYVGGGDYFSVFTYSGATGFSSGTTYHAVLVYQPTGERVGTGITFSG